LQAFTRDWSNGVYQFSKPQTPLIKSNLPQEKMTSSKLKSSRKIQNKFHQYLAETIPDNWNINAKHLVLICEYLQKVADGEIKRLAISLPPRSGKSETCLRFASFYLENYANSNVLVCGYSQSISRRFSRKSRQICMQRTGLANNHTSIDEWSLPNGSTYYVGSVNNPRTSIGFHLIVADDLIRNREEANSTVMKEKVHDFYREDLYSRLEPNGSLILVNTRWSNDDVIALATSLDPSFVVLNIPALCDNPDTDPLNRQLNESIFPERYSTEDYLEIKSIMGNLGFSALYQGQPINKEGAMFNVESIKIIDNLPPMVRKIRSYDVASSFGKGDYSVGVLMGIDKDNAYYILDVWREQLGTKERDDKILRIAEIDGNETKITLPLDPGAGKSLIFYWTKMLAGYNVEFVRPTKSKEQRAEPLSVQINNGNVYMARALWNREFLDEFQSFPFGVHDDTIDACSDAFNDLTTKKSRKWYAV
jgi:predicted phage terminase large subunit-like protein